MGAKLREKRAKKVQPFCSGKERFVRLAVLAAQWRDSVAASWDEYDAPSYAATAAAEGSEVGTSKVGDKPSARELLQAAVEGAATGAG